MVRKMKMWKRWSWLVLLVLVAGVPLATAQAPPTRIYPLPFPQREVVIRNIVASWTGLDAQGNEHWECNRVDVTATWNSISNPPPMGGPFTMALEGLQGDGSYIFWDSKQLSPGETKMLGKQQIDLLPAGRVRVVGFGSENFLAPTPRATLLDNLHVWRKEDASGPYSATHDVIFATAYYAVGINPTRIYSLHLQAMKAVNPGAGDWETVGGPFACPGWTSGQWCAYVTINKADYLIADIYLLRWRLRDWTGLVDAYSEEFALPGY